jgi:FAD/FMN-containing dehydrogenase
MSPPGFAGLWREDLRARAAYSEGAGIYRILPRAVAVPSTTRALRTLVAWAAAEGVPLVPRGAGSAMPGSSVGPGVMVDLSALDGAPLVVEPGPCRAVAGAAVTLQDLDWVAARQGLRMPVDPSSARWATCGGAVSTNAAGPRSLRYGPVRRWVEGLTLVTADAEVVELHRGQPPPDCAAVRRFAETGEPALRHGRWRVAASFPKVRKNTAGYALDAFLASGDLLDLVIGAEGTLGFVTGVRWRLEPRPVARAGVRAALRDVRRLGHCVPALLSLEPASVEFLDGSFLRFAGPHAVPLPRAAEVAREGALLMVEFEGPGAASLVEATERAAGILRPESLEVLVAGTEADIEALWAVRHAASPRLAALGDAHRSLQVIEDACVPVDRVGDYVVAVRDAAARAGLDVVMFGHAGDGHVHANLLPDVGRDGWLDAVRAVFEEVTAAVLALGGTPSGEHGDGRLRASLLERVYGWEVSRLFRQVKAVFDPAGILNPGVKVGHPADPLAHLKAGPGAAALPADVEAGLRWIERNGGYGAARLALADDPSGWTGTGPG